MTEQHEEYLTPQQVGKLFNVHAKTITRWARDGKLDFTYTLGGHRRYKKSQVLALLNDGHKDG